MEWLNLAKFSQLRYELDIQINGFNAFLFLTASTLIILILLKEEEQSSIYKASA